MFVLGVDANAVLGKQCETDDPSLIGRDGAATRNGGGHMLADWMCEVSFVSLNLACAGLH